MAQSEAHRAIIKARAQLLLREPFFGTLAMMLKLVEVPDDQSGHMLCPTMAVDGKSMFFCPGFVLKLSETQLMGVVAHEVMHCAYGHITRRGWRDPILWNVAGDFRINYDLLECGFELPDDKLHDSKYDGTWGTEDIFEDIKKMTKAKQKKLGQQGQFGTVIDAPTNEAKGANAQQITDALAKAWDMNVRMAAAVAKKHAGKMPGSIARLIEELDDPKIPWRTLLNNFIDQSMVKESSWRVPNRRFVAQNIYLPGKVSDAINHLVMAIDVSGSISNDLMKAMVGEGAGALDMRVTDRLTIIYADDGVRHVDQYEAGEAVTCQTPGGGGTDFADTFKWISVNAADATCIVYLTDMETCSWGEDPGKPVLWAAYNREARLAQIEPPFGSVIHVSSEF